MLYMPVDPLLEGKQFWNSSKSELISRGIGFDIILFNKLIIIEKLHHSFRLIDLNS